MKTRKRLKMMTLNKKRKIKLIRMMTRQKKKRMAFLKMQVILLVGARQM